MSTCRIAHCLVIGMCILAIDVAMYAQSTPAFTNKATDPKATQIGWFLEQEFSPYFYNCSNKQSMKTKKGVVVSTVPVPILTHTRRRLELGIQQAYILCCYRIYNHFAGRVSPNSPQAGTSLVWMSFKIQRRC